MSDPTNSTPSDPGSSPTLPDQNSNDPNANPTDPTLGDPNSSNPDPTSGNAVDPGTGTDPTSGANGDPSGTTSQDGTNSGTTDGTVPPDGANAPIPSQSALPIPRPVTLGPTQVSPTSIPTPTPNALPDSGNANGNNASQSAGGKSDDNTKTIIIASSVSGGVALILALLVIIWVYRRRNNKRRNTAFEPAIPPPIRRGSDATWIGPKVASSFDESKLEAGHRNSEASLESETTTLADFVTARGKSGAFSTPSHTPRPSLDKIKTQLDPMVPSDPFERPRLSIVEKPRSSLDRDATPLVPATRRRKSGAPTIRINSNSSFNSSVEIEQGDAMGPQSPGSPMLPLVTPVEPPAGWRAQMEYIPAPTRRDSMVSLSRQSSRASSRNSQVFDAPDPQGTKAGQKGLFSSALAKKRRSRADSIDPFRRSATTIAAARRKSRAESIASTRHHVAPGARRKSRAESIAPPTTPGGRRKSRAPSLAPSTTPRRRSQAARRVESPTESVFSTSQFEFVGLPKTPRTPTAARRSRGAEPRTPTARTPYTPNVPREPRTPGRDPRAPATVRTPRTPATPREPRTPRTPGGHPRRPSASVPRTPTSLDDAVAWSTVPLPPIPPAESRPLPTAPMSATRAELRLSGLSRTLSEVSRESPI